MLRGAKGPVLVALLLCAGASQAQTYRWHLELEGQSGPISEHSGTTTPGLEDTTEILAYGQNLYRPLVNGVPSQLQLRPIRLLKAVDGSSPRLAQALADNENLPTCELTLYQVSGGLQPLYRIDFSGAKVIGVSGGDDDSPTTTAFGTETVSILFTGAELTHFPSGQITTIP